MCQVFQSYHSMVQLPAARCNLYSNKCYNFVLDAQFGGYLIHVPYSRVVTPPLLKRNFALKRGGRNNENCIHLYVVTPPLPTQQYRCHSPVPHVRSLPQGYKRTSEQANTLILYSKDNNVVTTYSARVNIEVRASQTHVCMCKWGGV